MRYFLFGLKDMLYFITHYCILFVFFVPSFLACVVMFVLRFKRWLTHEKTWYY